MLSDSSAISSVGDMTDVNASAAISNDPSRQTIAQIDGPIAAAATSAAAAAAPEAKKAIFKLRFGA